MVTIMLVDVLELWTRTVAKIPIINPHTGLLSNSDCSNTFPRKINYINNNMIKINFKVRSTWIYRNKYPGLSFTRGHRDRMVVGFSNYNYLCNQCLSPLTLRVRIPLRWGVLYTTLCDKVCQWFSLVSSTTKTDRHDITEILLKVALNTINQPNQTLQWGNNFIILYKCII